ncbi:hypothetical protein DFR70_1021065 [Nocardia tenerifensis]|uniref:Uncharacterized protein n=1 Tax=Nocardia tenerifensis TaxID=228006 RepID=A0A318KCU3_9NOCA|nr:hypothetical protein [Nocardia tenerifensis]PXX69376.1 hypothetical protein DFR70_1021065 [Nocardia tenerifensis]
MRPEFAALARDSVLAKGSEGGGAALDQVIGLTVAAAVIAAGLFWLAYLHRTRRITWLKDTADRLGQWGNRPGWVALPIALFITTILTAMFGFIWDVSLHIGKGRDPGPLANPAHYFILVGLFFLFIAGMLAVILPLDEKPGPAAIRITRTWYAPVGGVLMAAVGLYALVGFPLDDIWHRLFGQDVTLWGPTHLMLIGGAGISLVAVLLLEFEGRLDRPDPDRPDGRFLWIFRSFAFGGLLIGLSVFQVEFDFGVQQFRLVFHPMLITVASTVALIAGRYTLGRGSALVAVVFAFLIRGVLAVLIGPMIGEPRNVFPLYLGVAVVVELMALLPLIDKPLWWGALTGLAAATAGIWLESLWVRGMFVDHWPSGMWPELLAMTVPVGVAGGALGALLGMVLRGEPLPRRPLRRGLVVAAVLIAAAATANGLRIDVPENASAAVRLQDAEPAHGARMVTADITLSPADLVRDDPEWVQILAWQGGDGSASPGRGLVVDQLRQVGPGHYVSTKPVPVSGNWKTVLRLQDGRMLTALPVYLPNDPGIEAEEVPALAEFTRPFVAEITVLQRERSSDYPSWLFTVASLVVLVCSLVIIAALSWGAARINLAYRADVRAERMAQAVRR